MAEFLKQELIWTRKPERYLWMKQRWRSLLSVAQTE